MPATLLLDRTSWDLVLDANGNIALATEPYALAQDAASAIKTWLGECFLDTSVGVPWLQKIFGQSPPPLSLLKEALVSAAVTVPDVAAAQVTIASASMRTVSGQVQVISSSSGQATAAPFSVVPLQGV